MKALAAALALALAAPAAGGDWAGLPWPQHADLGEAGDLETCLARRMPEDVGACVHAVARPCAEGGGVPQAVPQDARFLWCLMREALAWDHLHDRIAHQRGQDLAGDARAASAQAEADARFRAFRAAECLAEQSAWGETAWREGRRAALECRVRLTAQRTAMVRVRGVP